MSNEDTSIHDFDFDLICEYFSNIERQGPGSPEATLKALSFIDNLNNESSIIDIGCGTGGQTMVLAQNAPGILPVWTCSQLLLISLMPMQQSIICRIE